VDPALLVTHRLPLDEIGQAFAPRRRQALRRRPRCMYACRRGGGLKLSGVRAALDAYAAPTINDTSSSPLVSFASKSPTFWPRRMTTMRSAVAKMSCRLWLDDDHRHTLSRSVRTSSCTLRCSGTAERGGGLVHDHSAVHSDGTRRMATACRCPPDIWRMGRRQVRDLDVQPLQHLMRLFQHMAAVDLLEQAKTCACSARGPGRC